MIDKGLLALEWGMQQAGVDGSFPTEHGGERTRFSNIHSKAEFLEAAIHGVRLLKASDASPAFKARADALVPKFVRSARWMTQSSDLAQFRIEARNTNQRVIVALFLQEAGVLVGDDSLVRAAQSMIEEVLSAMTADGVLSEAGGFDSSYQAVSLERLSRYASTLAPSAWRTRVLSSLARGVGRMTASKTGAIDTAANSRTELCAANDNEPRTHRNSAVPLSLYYVSRFTNDPRLSQLANDSYALGNVARHKGRC